MDFVGHAQQFSEILAIHCERGDLTLREGEIWIGQNGRAERTPSPSRLQPGGGVSQFAPRRSREFRPAQCGLPVYDFTQGIFELDRTGRDVRLAAAER